MINGKQPDREMYNKAWTHHIQELSSLALAADIPYHEYRELRDKLHEWKNQAINNLYHNHKGT